MEYLLYKSLTDDRIKLDETLKNYYIIIILHFLKIYIQLIKIIYL